MSVRAAARSLFRQPLRRWLFLLVALGVAARLVRYLVGFPIWGDEAFVAVNFLTRDWKGLFAPLEFEMVAPVGWLLPTDALARLFGPGEYVLRLTALVAGLGAFLLFVRYARRFHRRHAALVAIALFAASYYPIRHGAEVKPYAFDLLAGTAISWCAWRVLQAAHEGSRWVAFALVAAVSVWCSYPAAFVAGGALPVLFHAAWESRAAWPSRKPWECRHAPLKSPMRPWSWCATLFLVSFVSMYLLVGVQQQWSDDRIVEGRQWEPHFPPWDRPWLLPWWLLEEHAGNMSAYPNGGPRFASAATLLLVVVGAVALWRRGRRRDVLLLLSPLLPMFVAATLRKYPYGGSARTTLHLAVPICLLAAEGFVTGVGGCWRMRRLRMMSRGAAARAIALGSRACVLVLAGLAVGTMAADVVHPYKGIGDIGNRAAIATLRDATRPGDRWVVFGAFGPSERAPDLRSWRGSAGRLRYYLLLDRRAIGVPLLWAPPVAALAADGTGRTFVITYRDNELPFPDELWRRYREELVAALGPPEESRFELGPAPDDPATGMPQTEELHVLCFAAKRR